MSDKKVPSVAFMEEGLETALLIAGKLAGIGSQLDAGLLERFLDSRPTDFMWEKACRAAIVFARDVQNP